MSRVRFLLLPWLKYYMNVNPWLFNLDHRFIQQITTNLSLSRLKKSLLTTQVRPGSSGALLRDRARDHLAREASQGTGSQGAA